jgi:hypothetical protein
MPTRVLSMVGAALAALLALGLLAAGGLLLWGDAQKDEQGYLSTERERFVTNTYALATENLDADLDGADWPLDHDRYGSIRLELNAGKPLFAGIARTSDVSRYLAGSAHALVEDISIEPFRADYRPVAGDRPPAAPGGQDFWVASVQGAGTRTLTWDVEDGDWSIVVMNADGSRGVDADVKAGAEVPFLSSLGWGTTIAGLLVLVLAAVLTVVGIRAGRKVSA